ncbi:hypothetical protein MJ588_04900 [Klebsiella pneumoniae]|nr:hypothetical protein MJ588_04900 [Klebsiella pneumoniae]
MAKNPHSKRKKRQQRAFHRDMPGNKSVYKYGRKVHIEYLHGVTLLEGNSKIIHKISESGLTDFDEERPP